MSSIGAPLVLAAEKKPKSTPLPTPAKVEKRSEGQNAGGGASSDLPAFVASYDKKVKAAIGAAWYRYVADRKNLITPGAVIGKFTIFPTGVRTIQSIEGAAPSAKEAVRYALKEAEVILPSPEMAEWIKKEKLEMIITFRFDVTDSGDWPPAIAKERRDQISPELAAVVRGDMPASLLRGEPTSYELMGEELPSYVKTHLVSVHAQVARAWNFQVEKSKGKLGKGTVVLVFDVLEDGVLKESSITVHEPKGEPSNTVEKEAAVKAVGYALKDATVVKPPERVVTWIKVHGLKYRVQLPIARR